MILHCPRQFGHMGGVPRIRTSGGATETGRRIKSVRRLLGWSQEKLGEAAGLDRVRIANIERGQNQASSAALREALRKALNVSHEAFATFLDGEFSNEESAAEWLLSQRSSYEAKVDTTVIWKIAARDNGDDPDDPSVARIYSSVFANMLRAAALTAHDQVTMGREEPPEETNG